LDIGILIFGNLGLSQEVFAEHATEESKDAWNKTVKFLESNLK